MNGQSEMKRAEYRLRLKPGGCLTMLGPPLYLCGGQYFEDGSTAGSCFEPDPARALLIEGSSMALRVAERYGCRTEILGSPSMS